LAELIEMPLRGILAVDPRSLAETAPAGSPPDWKERERALDVGASWIVEAPAGSGKTGLLIQRYLKLLAAADVERPEQVLAITFTTAATEEMHQRVISHLEGAAARTEAKSAFDQTTRRLAEAVLRRDAERAWGLLESPRRLNIRTIDSICAEIVRALPVTSGGGGGGTPVEQPEAMYREAGRRTLMQLGGHDLLLNDALRMMLLHRDGSVTDCEALIAEMLAARDQWGELVPLGREELTEEWLEERVHRRLDRALELEVCRGLSDLAQAIPEITLQEITVLAAEMGDAPGYGEGPSPMAVCAGLTRTPGEALDHLEHWQALIHLLVKADGDWRAGFRSDWLRFTWDNRHTPSIKGLIASLQDQDGVLPAIKRFNSLPPARYPEEQWLVAKALFRVLSRALAELQLVFAERGGCDFAEPALLARAALRQERGLEGYESTLGMELRHLLVDEMQDTSSAQYELIGLLTEDWNDEGKTVFLVGDPQQSIYLFRQARVERFVATMRTERIGELRLGRLRLTANFRSQAGLVHGFNGQFGQIFPSSPRVDDVPFVAAQAVRAETSGIEGDGGIAWHAAVAGGGRLEIGGFKRRSAVRQAKAVRAIAERWRARPLPDGRTDPWKLAVLVRSRRELRAIVAALKEDKGCGAVPFRAIKVESLREQREVLDLLALTRALKHPADQVAWWAVLHAPWCGLGLSDLHVLAGEDNRDFAESTVWDLVARRGDLLTVDAVARLQRVWPVLQAAMERRSRLRVPELVERTWRSLGGDAALSTGALANALQYLKLLDELDRETGGVDLEHLDRTMHRLYAAVENHAEAVDLVTIHGAKGLEWDVVMVPELERKAPPARSRLLEWEEIVGGGDEGAARVLLAPIAGRGEQSAALNSWLRGIRTAREAAERRRLFYVACTRAREELHLFGTANVLKDGHVKAESGSLLEVAWPAAEVRFREAKPIPLSAQTLPFEGLALAAAAVDDEDDLARPAMLERLPVEFDPLARFARRRSQLEQEVERAQPRSNRAEGSFAARSFGNAVHAFLELVARRLAEGEDAGALASEVLGWRGRAAAMLRGDGLPPAMVEALAGRVVVALSNTLKDATGRWIVGAGVDARSEYALTVVAERSRKVRMDRVFWAGASPGAQGSECFWIVDYKTGSHGAEGVDAFLEREHARYLGQMEDYARARGMTQVRVGLWYPMLGRLIWWIPNTLT